VEVARSEVLSALQRWSTEKNLKHVIRIHQVNHGKSKWLYILLVLKSSSLALTQVRLSAMTTSTFDHDVGVSFGCLKFW
jgi:hypothetical protein